MRELAACYAGQRLWWRARYIKDTIPPGGGTPVYLLERVRDTTGTEIMDHCWIRTTAEMRERKPRSGSIVTFSAVVRRYQRMNGTWDYGLFDIEAFKHRRKR